MYICMNSYVCVGSLHVFHPWAASKVPLWANIVVVIGMTLVFRLLAYVSLRSRTRVR